MSDYFAQVLQVRRSRSYCLRAVVRSFEIRRVLTSIEVPRVDHVLITDELNAAILQLPSLGIFGWHRNYLMIDLPLMKSLTREQFKAVLAHELSHLAKGHGIESHSIYRQRLRWSRLVAVLE